jgi:hypothetical protein
MIICSSSKKVSILQEELSKVAFGVPNSFMLGEPFLILAGTSLTLQNQIYTRQGKCDSVIYTLFPEALAYFDTRVIEE